MNIHPLCYFDMAQEEIEAFLAKTQSQTND
jgi:hypothetical protein